MSGSTNESVSISDAPRQSFSNAKKTVNRKSFIISASIWASVGSAFLTCDALWNQSQHCKHLGDGECTARDLRRPPLGFPGPASWMLLRADAFPANTPAAIVVATRQIARLEVTSSSPAALTTIESFVYAGTAFCTDTVFTLPVCVPTLAAKAGSRRELDTSKMEAILYACRKWNVRDGWFPTPGPVVCQVIDRSAMVTGSARTLTSSFLSNFLGDSSAAVVWKPEWEHRPAAERLTARV